MRSQILAVIALSGLFLFNVIELNRRKMGPIEFVLWELGILLLATVTLFQDFGQKLSTAIGFELLANFIFSFVIIALLGLVRMQSRQIGRLQKQLQDLVQAIALKRE